MSTDVEICNTALDFISGKATIQSLDENSIAARTCKRHYDRARRALLARRVWSFAKARADLATVTDVSAPWLAAFALPSGFIKDVELVFEGMSNTHDPIPYEIAASQDQQKRRLYCNLSAPVLVYVFDQKLVPAMTQLFQDALSLEIAARIAMPLSVSPQLAREARQAAREAFFAAAEDDANSGQKHDDPDAGWIQARA